MLALLRKQTLVGRVQSSIFKVSLEQAKGRLSSKKRNESKNLWDVGSTVRLPSSRNQPIELWSRWPPPTLPRVLRTGQTTLNIKGYLRNLLICLHYFYLFGKQTRWFPSRNNSAQHNVPPRSVDNYCESPVHLKCTQETILFFTCFCIYAKWKTHYRSCHVRSFAHPIAPMFLGPFIRPSIFTRIFFLFTLQLIWTKSRGTLP